MYFPKVIFIVLFCFAVMLGSPAEAGFSFRCHVNGAGLLSAPRAEDDFYLYVNYDWMRAHPLQRGVDEVSPFSLADDGMTGEAIDNETLNIINGFFDDIKNVYAQRIMASDMFSEGAKSAAIQKLDALTLRIGLPGEGHNAPDAAKKTGAYYDYLKNEVLLNPALLVSPFFNPATNSDDRETNLGSIGVILAHEISHSFDVHGGNYDPSGNMVKWYTEDDDNASMERLAVIADFMSKYSLDDDENVNGCKKAYESFADMRALDCLTRIVMRGSPSEEESREGLRRLFVSYAWTSRQMVSDRFISEHREALHALDNVRVNAALSSNDMFYYVYDVKIGDGMYVRKRERPRVW